MTNLQPIENNNQRVLTTAQIAEQYETDANVIQRNFQRHKEWYIEGKHYYCMTGDMLREFKATGQIDVSPNLNKFYLWTGKGALLHAKSLNTDKAWQAYEVLVDTYFNVQQQTLLPQQQLSPMEMIAAMATNAVEMERRLKEAENKVAETSSKLEQALDVFANDTLAITDWAGYINGKIMTVCKQNHLSSQSEKGRLYKELEATARCNLTKRVTEKQKRMKKAGAKYADWKNVAKLDVISDDPKLRVIFDGIVKKFEAKYIQGDNVQMGLLET